jgi:hypothetical protein
MAIGEKQPSSRGGVSPERGPPSPQHAANTSKGITSRPCRQRVSPQRGEGWRFERSQPCWRSAAGSEARAPKTFPRRMPGSIRDDSSRAAEMIPLAALTGPFTGRIDPINRRNHPFILRIKPFNRRKKPLMQRNKPFPHHVNRFTAPVKWIHAAAKQIVRANELD